MKTKMYIITLGIDIKGKPRRLYSKSKVSRTWLQRRLSSKYRQRIAYLLKIQNSQNDWGLKSIDINGETFCP